MPEVVDHEEGIDFLTVLEIGTEKPLGDLLDFAGELGEVMVVNAVGIEEIEEIPLELGVSEEETNVVLGNIPEDRVAVLYGLVEVAEVAAEFERSLFEVPLVESRVLPRQLGKSLHQELEDELEVLFIPFDGRKELALLDEFQQVLGALNRGVLGRNLAFALPLDYFYNNLLLDQRNF